VNASLASDDYGFLSFRIAWHGDEKRIHSIIGFPKVVSPEHGTSNFPLKCFGVIVSRRTG
jgi:hypothetical protein